MLSAGKAAAVGLCLILLEGEISRKIKVLGGRMADRAGFEPAVAVTPRTLSKRVP